MRLPWLIFIPCLLTSCHDPGLDDPFDDHDGSRGHVHAAPHGGTLVVLGDELLHVELLLDNRRGILDLYVLDGEAERAVRIPQPEIEIRVNETPETLQAVESPLTGETRGDTSQFRTQSSRLVGIERFAGRIIRLTALGQTFEGVTFQFPEGNER